MTEKNELEGYNNIWSIKDSIIDKNNTIKKNAIGLSDEDKLSSNIDGYIINHHGNLVAKFGFFVETAGKDRIDLKVSPDGFLGTIYNKPINIIVGYGHPLGFTGMVDITKSDILHLGPEQTKGDQIIFSIANDESLEEQGVVVIMRDIDVTADLLPDEVKMDFAESLREASTPVTDMNELETSYNAYIKEMYNILGQAFKEQSGENNE
jgi:hypothetical protein